MTDHSFLASSTGAASFFKTASKLNGAKVLTLRIA